MRLYFSGAAGVMWGHGATERRQFGWMKCSTSHVCKQFRFYICTIRRDNARQIHGNHKCIGVKIQTNTLPHPSQLYTYKQKLRLLLLKASSSVSPLLWRSSLNRLKALDLNGRERQGVGNATKSRSFRVVCQERQTEINKQSLTPL